MAEPVREQALAKIAEKLAGMTGTRPWGGVYPDPPVVGRQYRSIDQVNQFPHVIVLEGQTSRMLVDQERSAGLLVAYTHRMSVVVYGYVRQTADATRSTWQQRLWDDVARTLMKHCRLDEVVRSLDFGEEFETEWDDRDVVGGFIQEFFVEIDEEMEVA